MQDFFVCTTMAATAKKSEQIVNLFMDAGDQPLPGWDRAWLGCHLDRGWVLL